MKYIKYPLKYTLFILQRLVWAETSLSWLCAYLFKSNVAKLVQIEVGVPGQVSSTQAKLNYYSN